MAMEIFRLIGSVFVDTDQAEESIKKTDEKAGSLGKTLIDGIGTAAKWGAGIVAGATVATGAVLGVATASAGAMDAIDKGSAKVGISKQAYQEWSYVLGQNGMDISKMEVGMKTLVAAMDGAAAGTASAVEKFDALGLSIYDSNGNMKDQETMMNEAIYALANMENGTEKARLATELFGKSGVEMMPMLNGGAEGIADLTQRAHDLGLVMSDEAVTSGVVLGDTMDDVKQTFGALGNQLGVTFMPVIQSVLELILANVPKIQDMFNHLTSSVIPWLSDSISNVIQTVQNASNWMKEHETLITMIAIAVGTLTTAIIAYNVAQAIKNAGGIAEVAQLTALIAAETAHTVAVTVATAATAAFGAVVGFLTSPVTLVVAAIGALIAIVVLLVQNWDTVKEAASKCWEWIKKTWEKVANWFNENVIQPIGNFFSGLWTSIKNVFGSVGTWFKNAFTSAWTAIKNVFSSWGSFFSGLWDKIKTTFSNIGTNIANAISNSVKAGINGVISAIEGTINTGVNLINGAINLINKLPGVSVGKIGKLSLPRLARGGVVDEPTVAQIGEDGAEAVVPLERNTGWIDRLSQKVAQSIVVQTGQGDSNVSLDKVLDKMDELLDALRANQIVTLNKREFARLVKEVG